MQSPVRALCAFLTVWLAVAGSLPTCCWSLAGAHNHAASQKSAASERQTSEHHHHNIGDSTVAAAQVSLLPALPQRDCGTGSDSAVITTGSIASPGSARAIAAATIDAAVPQPTGLLSHRSDHAPPGGSFRSAFLNPLRV